jgi:outer membrane protein TolC
MIAGLLSCLGTIGCSRAWYRNQADEEVVDVLAEKGGYLDNGLIDPLPHSRLADAYDLDCPPIPPDDPASHELMHYVDDKAGSDVWHANGDAPDVDAKTWINALPRDENGDVMLSMKDAVQVARVNSRDYQTNLENLYLSALDVTLRRFRFDNQYSLGTGTFALFTGPKRNRGSSELEVGAGGAISRATATGGEFVLGLANSIMWEFSSGQTDMLGSTFDFAITQPLLRGAGRAVVLENLTQSERRLLANVRQMEQFRRGFYIDIVSGRSSGPGPSTGGNVGQNGLGLIAGNPSGAPRAGGFLGLLQNQQQIRNQVANIAALRDSLSLLEFLFEGNRIRNRLQVDQARQALLNAQTNLLVQRASYATSVDSYKVELGLPPELPLLIDDPLLDRFNLIAPELPQLQTDLEPLLFEVRRQREEPTREGLDASAAKLAGLESRITARIESALGDLEQIRPRIPERVSQLQRVKEQVESTGADVDRRVYDEELLRERVAYLEKRLPALTQEMTENRASLRDIRKVSEDLEPSEYFDQLNENGAKLSDLLLELSLLQAETRLQNVVLTPLEISAGDGIQIARTSRLDWMNARANLVDSWRQIEVRANALEGFLNLTASGDIGTKGDNPVEFSSDNSSLRFGLEFDTPVNRLEERNNYRQTLINYQRARRDYMRFEDQLKQSVRNTVRFVDLSRINFEVRRAAVQVAIAQVDIARLNLEQPPKIGQGNTQASPTATRDLVSALNDLLDAQNDFLNVWVNYEVLRMLLDFELGTMELDENGLWRDPGPVVTPN